ncbi:MAG: selenide, water dikinase SelD [Candidatus Marinimicrobia bacterium]|nr:selenide, water dikinase SelD [Candidatus Neomarinimicrobiota bacterium]
MGPGDLTEILKSLNLTKDNSVLLDFESSDDSAAYRQKNGDILVQTVDFFTPIVDDPYDFGQIAASNSLSDIYAMGGTPLFALNIVGFPIEDLPKTILTQILQGGIDKAKEAGIPIIGGHSIKDKEPKYGLVVTGQVNENRMWTNSRAKPGDKILLTKKLGTGIISTAIKRGCAGEKSIKEAVESMKTLNSETANQLKNYQVNAVTDISGFGLLGHLKEMCEASNVSAEIDFSSIKFLSGVFDLAKKDNIPGGTLNNFQYLKNFTDFSSKTTRLDHLLVSDAQTSGGLLVSLPPDEANRFINSCRQDASIIGEFKKQVSPLIRLSL